MHRNCYLQEFRGKDFPKIRKLSWKESRVLQTYHVYSTFHFISTWNTHGVFVGSKFWKHNIGGLGICKIYSKSPLKIYFGNFKITLMQQTGRVTLFWWKTWWFLQRLIKISLLKEITMKWYIWFRILYNFNKNDPSIMIIHLKSWKTTVDDFSFSDLPGNLANINSFPSCIGTVQTPLRLFYFTVAKGVEKEELLGRVCISYG